MTIFEIKFKFWKFWKRYILNAFSHEREAHHIGWMNKRITVQKIIEEKYTNFTDYIESKLINAGWQPNYFSFADKGQITSMRKMFVDSAGYWWQDHVRVHDDGEIRGHREWSYEESAYQHVIGEYVGEIPEDIRTEIIKILS